MQPKRGRRTCFQGGSRTWLVGRVIKACFPTWRAVKLAQPMVTLCVCSREVETLDSRRLVKHGVFRWNAFEARGFRNVLRVHSCQWTRRGHASEKWVCGSTDRLPALLLKRKRNPRDCHESRRSVSSYHASGEIIHTRTDRRVHTSPSPSLLSTRHTLANSITLSASKYPF